MSAGAKSRRYRAAAGGRLSAKYRRYLALVAAAVLVAGSTITAMAETIDREPLKPIGPPAALPKIQHGEQTQNLDRLFEALKVAPDDDSAKYVENRIWAVWLASGSDTANLLMGRAKVAIDNKDYDLAIKLLNAIIDIKPDFVEAWNRRATVYYTKKDFGRALADLHEVLAREPRHFGALAGLGIILQELGDDKHALEAFRRALAIHPHLERIPELVHKLSDKLDGRDI
ncbi:MAG TPA: tetratricopeptide repeat protein [Xanthobacteraceae bacterium]|jgi:tetratricopeptide (TPR) repeat protein